MNIKEVERLPGSWSACTHIHIIIRIHADHDLVVFQLIICCTNWLPLKRENKKKTPDQKYFMKSVVDVLLCIHVQCTKLER